MSEHTDAVTAALADRYAIERPVGCGGMATVKQAARWGESYSFHMAECYALLDEKTLALEWLENATRRGFINYPFLAEGAPFLENVRNEERFEELLEHVEREWEQFDA